MQGLTKENFFNAISDKYPFAHIVFLEWIDEQKEELHWNEIFNSNSDYQDNLGKNAPAPKFHNLPFELQFGLLSKLLCKKDRLRLLQYDLEFVKRHLEDMYSTIDYAVKSGKLDKK